MSFAIDANTIICLTGDQLLASSALADVMTGSGVVAVGSPTAQQAGPYTGRFSRGFNGSSQAFDSSAWTDYRTEFKGDMTFELVFKSSGHGVNAYRNVFNYGHFNDWYLRLRYNPTLSDGVFVHLNNGTYAGPNTGANTFESWATGLVVPADAWCLLQLRKTVTAQGTTPPNTRLNTFECWLTRLTHAFSSTPGHTRTNVLNPAAASHTPHWHIGRNGGDNNEYFNGNIAGLRVSKVARTALELQDSFTRWQGVVTDITKPAVANLSPTPGTTLQKTQPVSLEVTDVGGLRRVMVVASFPGLDLEEVVHNGTSWGPRYSLAPNARTAITNGYRFTVLRRGGWPAPPTLTAYAVDTAGNEAA